MTEAQDPTDRSIKAFLAQWQPLYVIGVDENSTEHRIPTSKNTKKWDLMVKTLRELDCVRVRAYDRADAVLGTKVLRTIDTGPAGTVGGVTQPATSGGVDVAAIVAHTTTGIVDGFKTLIEAVAVKVVGEITKAHATSMAEMVNITKIATADAAEFRKMVHEDLIARRKAVEEELEARELEFEEREAEREAARAESEQMGTVMAPLIQAAAPELTKKFFEFMGSATKKPLTNGATGPASPEVTPAPKGGVSEAK
jgi:hypothetical protein